VRHYKPIGTVSVKNLFRYSVAVKPSSQAGEFLSQTDKTDDKSLCVLKAASRVFLEHGFSAATTDMIQRAAGVSKATVYSRYRTKEALFAAVIDYQCSHFTDRVQQIEVTPGNIRKVLLEIGHTYLSLLLSTEALALFRTVIEVADRFPRLAHSFYSSGPGTMTRILAAHLETAASAGEIDVQVIGLEPAATLFMSMLRGEAQLIALTHPDSQASEVQVEQWVNQAVTTFLRAYGTAETH